MESGIIRVKFNHGGEYYVNFENKNQKERIIKALAENHEKIKTWNRMSFGTHTTKDFEKIIDKM